MYRILSAEFVTSVKNIDDLANFQLPQVAFVGRSNVGKSSLINAVCSRRSLAHTSKTPGRTQSVNLFEIQLRADEIPEEMFLAHLVDLPGYGYAQVSKSDTKELSNLLFSYFTSTEYLKALFLLVDSRREPKEEESWVLALEGISEKFVVLTKADKASQAELEDMRKLFVEKFSVEPSNILSTALVGKKKQGAQKVVDCLCQVIVN